MPELVPLSGSDRSELPTATPAATPLDPSQVITVTVLLRRRAEIPAELINTTATVSTEELGSGTGPTRPTPPTSPTCSAATG